MDKWDIYDGLSVTLVEAPTAEEAVAVFGKHFVSVIPHVDVEARESAVSKLAAVGGLTEEEALAIVSG